MLLYSIIYIFFSGFAVNTVLAKFNVRKSVMVISDRSEDIVRCILKLLLSVTMFVAIETLDIIAEYNNKADHFNYGCKCHKCGCDVDIEITRTSGGYGLLGGVLYEPNPENLLAFCAVCYLKSGGIKQPTRLTSKVV